MGVVINMYVQSGHRTLKSALSQEEIDGINWFLMCCYKFKKGKFYFNSFWVVLVKTGRSLLGHEALKSAKISWFLVCWHKFSKLSINYWLGMLKNRRDLLDHGTLKSGVSNKWLDESSRLIESYLKADSDCIIFGLTANLLCILCWVSTAVVLLKNDVLLLRPTGKVLEFGFAKSF